MMGKKFLLFMMLFSFIIAVYSQDKENKECSGGWIKYENNPVLGGDPGTIFDISVLKNNDGIYQMYCSCLKSWENGTWSKEKGDVERGKDYNHSTFCDLIISGLIG